MKKKSIILLILLILIIPSVAQAGFFGDLVGSYEADSFFTELIKNEANLTGGYAIFEFKNPHYITAYVLDRKNIDSDFEQVLGEVTSYEYYVKKPVEYSYQDYTQTCITKYTDNGTQYADCTPKEYYNVTYYKEEFVPLTSELLTPRSSIEVKIEAKWKASSHKAIDWIPILKTEDEILKQDKWAWWNTSCNYKTYHNFSVNNGTSTNFPIFYNLTSGNINFSLTEDDGSDIHVVDITETTELSHFVHTWNESNESYMYAKFPEVNTTLVEGYLYYNCSGVTNTNSTNDTFDNLISYFRMEEPAADYRDEANVGNMSMASGTTVRAIGSLYFGQDFELADTDIMEPPNDELYEQTDVTYLLNTIRESSHTGVIMDTGSNNIAATNYGARFISLGNTLDFSVYSGGGDGDRCQVASGAWASGDGQIAAVWDNADHCRVFIDGDQQANTNDGRTITYRAGTTTNLTIGGRYYTNAYSLPYDGVIDEAYYFGEAKNNTWIGNFFNQPTITFAAAEQQSITVITLNEPVDDTVISVTDDVFNCSYSNSVFEIENITLTIWNGTDWFSNDTVDANSTLGGNASWDITLYEDVFEWNCLARDNQTPTILSFADNNFTLTIDTTDPTLTLDAPTNNQIHENFPTAIDLNYTVFDTNISTCWFTLEDVAENIIGGCANTTFNLNASGQRNLTIFANDTAGNQVNDSAIVNMSQTQSIFTHDNTTGIPINSFTVSVTNGTVLTESTSNNTVIIPWVSLPLGSVTKTITASGYGTRVFANTTNNTTFWNSSNANYTLQPAGLFFLVEDELNGSGLIFNATLTGSNITTFTNVASIQENITALPTGDVRLDYTRSDSPQRTVFIAINNNTFTAQQAFALNTVAGLTVRFHIQDLAQNPIVGARVTARRDINSTTQIIDQDDTDASGTATLWLWPDSAYNITTVFGSITQSATITPTQNDFTITLDITAAINFDKTASGVRYSISPQVNRIILVNNTTGWVNVSYTSTGGHLEYYGLNITHSNGTTLFSNNTTTPGTGGIIIGQFTANETVSGDYVNASLFFRKFGFTEETINKQFFLFNTSQSSFSLFTVFGNAATGLNEQTKWIISILFAGVGVITASVFVGLGGGAIIGLMILAFFASIAWFDVIITMVLGMVVVLAFLMRR